MPITGQSPDQLRDELCARGWQLEERVKGAFWTVVVTRGDKSFASSGGDQLRNLHAVYHRVVCEAMQ